MGGSCKPRVIRSKLASVSRGDAREPALSSASFSSSFLPRVFHLSLARARCRLLKYIFRRVHRRRRDISPVSSSKYLCYGTSAIFSLFLLSGMRCGKDSETQRCRKYTRTRSLTNALVSPFFSTTSLPEGSLPIKMFPFARTHAHKASRILSVLI